MTGRLDAEYCLRKRYEKKLLEPGWPGELSPDELSYIKSKLKSDNRLRVKWGFKRGAGKISEHKIRQVALHGGA